MIDYLQLFRSHSERTAKWRQRGARFPRAPSGVRHVVRTKPSPRSTHFPSNRWRGMAPNGVSRVNDEVGAARNWRHAMSRTVSLPRALIVEDEIVIAMDLEAQMKKLGFEVCGVTSNAREALQIAM